MLHQKKTVDDMYKYAKEEDSKLLSSFGADNEGFHFWDEYRSKYKKYDKLFNRMFNSFKYFMQNDEQTIAEITEEFTDDVYNHLMVNAKKYEELYRVNVVNDNDYSITDNYNITETLEKETDRTDINTYGSRTDTSEQVVGSKTDSKTESLGSYTDTTESVSGSRTDSSEQVVGSKTDTETETLGGAVNSIEHTKGEQQDTIEDGIAGFNSSNYAKDTNKSSLYGERTDSTEETLGSRSNSKSNVYGAQTNTEENIKGQQTDNISEVHGSRSNTENVIHGSQTNTEENIKGQQIDNLSGLISEEYTLTRRGNIGVRTITEVLEYHEQFWTVYEFYTLIFKEICAELLSI